MSNLRNFLQSVTPIVPSKSLPEDTTEYFTLGDLWDCYEEWSAYGVGAPITLKDGVPVVQYYAPRLSAIQIYTIKSPATLSNGNDIDKLCKTSNNNSSNFYIESEVNSNNRFGYLYLESIEVSSLAWRAPLMNKVIELSKEYPEILSLKSVDLSPASWMAITWCPIYHIPMTDITKNVSTYFLTYHTLSAAFQENLNGETGEDIPSRSSDGGIPLSPFGLASYKMQNYIWMNKAEDVAKFNDLQGAADSWLKQLNFRHHDFNIFTSKFKNMDHIFLY